MACAATPPPPQAAPSARGREPEPARLERSARARATAEGGIREARLRWAVGPGPSLRRDAPERTAPAQSRALAPLSGQRGVYGGACAQSRFQGGAFYSGSLRTLRLRGLRAVARVLGGCWLPLRVGGVDANLSGEARLR